MKNSFKSLMRNLLAILDITQPHLHSLQIFLFEGDKFSPEARFGYNRSEDKLHGPNQ